MNKRMLVRTGIVTAAACLLSGCRSLESIPYLPARTPEDWLRMQPYTAIQIGARQVLIVQPSTSAIVYLLGLVAILAGIYFLRTHRGQRSRIWWALALVCWGAGALFAGTSYEAFGYSIKCAGRSACIWTSGWEILYLLLSAASANAMLAAVAYSCASGSQRRRLLVFAGLDFALYLLVVLVGAALPIQWMISFELLLAFCAPVILLLLILNARRYARIRQPLDRTLLVVWGGLVLIIAAYFAYYLSGLAAGLWARGVWFTENDVLHIGLILWMAYIAAVASRWVVDLPDR